MTDNYDTYTREELNALIDCIMGLGMIIGVPMPEGGFQQYRIRGIYVSPTVIEQAIQERLAEICK